MSTKFAAPFSISYILKYGWFVHTAPKSVKKDRVKTPIGCLLQYLKEGLWGDEDGTLEKSESLLLRDMSALEKGQIDHLDPYASEDDQRPIAVVLISTEDDDLAILGDGAVYSFLMKMKEMSAHFKVVPKVRSVFNLKSIVQEVQRDYPGREIQHLELISHGWNGELCTPIHQMDLSALSDGASVIFDSCSISTRPMNVAQRLSAQNPHCRVFASPKPVLLADTTFKDGVVEKVQHLHLKEPPKWIQKTLLKSKWISEYLEEADWEVIPALDGAVMDEYQGGQLVA